MPIWKVHPEEDLIRYLDGTLGEDDRTKVETHLATCAACRENLAFIKDFNEGISELGPEKMTTSEPCLDSWTLVSYESGDLAEP